MKKKPYTNQTLFTTITDTLKKNNLLPDHLDYHLSAYQAYEVKSYEFDIVGDLTFGGSEGVYLTLFLQGYFIKGEKFKKIELGTFKTLEENRNAFYDMAKLMADFIWVGTEFVNENIDDFDFR